jgi:hypothetical protein
MWSRARNQLRTRLPAEAGSHGTMWRLLGLPPLGRALALMRALMAHVHLSAYNERHYVTAGELTIQSLAPRTLACVRTHASRRGLVPITNYDVIALNKDV